MKRRRQIQIVLKCHLVLGFGAQGLTCAQADTDMDSRRIDSCVQSSLWRVSMIAWKKQSSEQQHQQEEEVSGERRAKRKE